MLQIPELLAPAGDLERLRYAINYGADAVGRSKQNLISILCTNLISCISSYMINFTSCLLYTSAI